MKCFLTGIWRRRIVRYWKHMVSEADCSSTVCSTACHAYMKESIKAPRCRTFARKSQNSSNAESGLIVILSLHWRHNGCDCVPNHQPHYCFLNRLFGRRSKKRSKLRVSGLCAGNSPGTGEFPAQMASNAENVCIWLRHHGATHLWRKWRWHPGIRGRTHSRRRLDPPGWTCCSRTESPSWVTGLQQTLPWSAHSVGCPGWFGVASPDQHEPRTWGPEGSMQKWSIRPI